MKAVIPFFSKSELETRCILNNLDKLIQLDEIKEIILVDDNPETEIPKKIIEFTKNSKINVTKNKQNKGFVKTINEHWNPKDKLGKDELIEELS